MHRFLWSGLIVCLSFCWITATEAATNPFLKQINKSAQNNEATQHESLNAALDQIISTLQNNQQRTQLVNELKALRIESKNQISNAASSSLLDTLENSIDALNGVFNNYSFFGQWRQLITEVGHELKNSPLLQQNKLSVLFGFIGLLSAWLALALITRHLLSIFILRHNWPKHLTDKSGLIDWFCFLIYRLSPWIFGFVFAVIIYRASNHNLGMALSMICAYAIVCGAIFSVMAETIFALFQGSHKKVALKILQQRGFWLLTWIGFCFALGDGLIGLESNFSTTLPKTMQLLASLAHILADILAIVFITKFRRPISHLIRNRSYNARQNRPAITEILRFISRLWYLPFLLLLLMSLLHTLSSIENTSSAVGRVAGSALLFVCILITTRLLRRQRENTTQKIKLKRRREQQIYYSRLSRLGYTLAQIILWLIFIELIFWVWGFSIKGVLENSTLGQQFINTVLAIGFTLFIAWGVWIMLDAALQHTLLVSARLKGRNAPNARALTIMPLIRNVLLATIATIALIAILANLGVNVLPLLAGAGVIGLAFAFGAQSLIQDLITGLFIIIEDSMAVGDYIDTDGHLGTVEGLTIRTVRIRDIDGIVHTIPFSQIKILQNYSREFGYALFRIAVAPQVSLDEMTRIMFSIVEEMRQDLQYTADIWSNLELQGIEKFESGTAILRARLKTAPCMQWIISRAFNWRLKQYFDSAGVNIAAPRLSVHVESQASQPINSRSEQ